jgi:hypothetical protein
MALDPEDPLIPLPWQMGNIRAYRAQRAVEAERDRIKMEKEMLDLEEKRRETPAGRVAQAEALGNMLERSRQRREGIEISPEVGAMTTAEGGPSLLEASSLQGDILARRKAEEMRLAAMENILTGGQGVVPTAKLDVGGITQTVPAMRAPTAQADLQAQVYNATWPKFSQIYESQGFAPQDAERMGKDAAAKELVKNANSGKINLLLQDGSTLSVDFSRAMQMAKDPTTSPAIRNQLISVLGETEAPKAPNWVKTRLGR